MRILLTGSSGMVGSNFCELPKISSFDILAPSSTELNLFNYSKVEQYIQQNNPDIIIHAAGCVGGIESKIKNPVKFLIENLDMGRNIVWAAHKAGVKKLINIGSTCMYPCNAVNPLNEESMLLGELEEPNEGYALAKIMVSRLCTYISRANPEFQYKTILPCNLYGRWDKFNPEDSHLIPAIIHKIHQAKITGQHEVCIWGDGLARREFMYATDLADCLLHAVVNFETMPYVMNVGIGFDYAIDDYYRAVAELAGYRGSFTYDYSKPVGIKQRVVDISKITSWGWKAKTDLRDGLAKTYDFYLKNLQEIYSK